MLEKPNISDATIIACLRDDFGVTVVQITFLPLGADRDTAVYRAMTDAGESYFVKLRSGVFDDMTVIIPKLLHDQGITQIIAPLPTRSGELAAILDRFRVMLYPFVEGHSGFEVPLVNEDWIEFGRALKAVHSAFVPPEIEARVHRETYSAYWRDRVREFQQQIEKTHFADPVAAQLAAFLQAREKLVSHVVNRAEKLASVLQEQSLPFILCHSDIHVGNLLLHANAAQLSIVDWDNPIMAPKERDLMFVGAGIGTSGLTARSEKELFYQGYGSTQIDPIALTYYRYERIVQDIAAYCEQLLLTDEGGEDRKEGLRQLMSQFEPYNVIDMASGSEMDLPPELQSWNVS